MIKNRLATLLAEKKITITKASLDTGISRNSLTAIAHNNSDMIRIDTINTLCRYLGVSPNDFFEFIPFDTFFEMNYMNVDLKISRVDPLESDDYFKILDFYGEILFTVEGFNYKQTFELFFTTINEIIFPIDISNNFLKGIEVNLEFKNPLDQTYYFGAVGHYYYSSLFNQNNYSLLRNMIEEAMSNKLMNIYYDKYDLSSFYEEQLKTALKEYVFIRKINSSFIKNL